MFLKKVLSLSALLFLAACGDSENYIGQSNQDDEFISSSSQEDVRLSSSSKKLKSSSSSRVHASSSSADKKTSSSSNAIKNSSSSVAREQSSSSGVLFSVVPIKDKSLGCVAQKGPFAIGSTITVYELDGNYAQTDNSLVDTIETIDWYKESGTFKVSNVTLASQYALFEVNGYFYSEIDGKMSGEPISLNALADLSSRDKVNINVLTHLEYKRVLYLVKTGISFSDAKKQAESEVLQAFGIEGDFSSSEDLNIFGTKPENAALLAMSALTLCEGNDSLSERLSKIVIDFETDGRWDDEITKAKIADCAYEKDLAVGLDSIHNIVKKWNVGLVPNFERFVRNFWYENYGLEECNFKNNGKILDLKNEHSALSGSNVHFICKDSVWVVASEIDMFDVFDKKAADGEFLTGPESGKKYKYDENLNEWQYASALEEALDNACTNKRIGLTVKDEKEKLYYCSANGWSSPADGWNWDVPPKYRFNPAITYGEMTDTRDGKKYSIVEIGEGDKKQVWMAENLNYYNASDSTLNGYSWCFGTKESDNTAICDVAGRLYSWSAAAGKEYEKCGQGRAYCDIEEGILQGSCPPGWHLPTNEEWELLFDNVGGIKTAAKYLKSQTGWNNCDACLDEVGFSALPAGYKLYESWFNYAGQSAMFWSASVVDAISAYQVHLGDMWDSADIWASKKDSGFSVRCLKD